MVEAVKAAVRMAAPMVVVQAGWMVVALVVAGMEADRLVVRREEVREVQVMALGWLTSYAITFAIVEQFQVLVLSAGPSLLNEEHRCGRCMVRCRTIYNELCAP